MSLRRVGMGRALLPIPPASAVEGLLAPRRNVTGRRTPESVCVVRSPAQRIEDELHRRCREERRCNHRVEQTLLATQAALLARTPPTTEKEVLQDRELRNVLPQARYVWRRDGSVACKCVLL